MSDPDSGPDSGPEPERSGPNGKRPSSQNGEGDKAAGDPGAGVGDGEPVDRDEAVIAFQLDNKPVRGRIARLHRSIDEILTNHNYPDPVAGLLGEAVVLAVLVGSSLKFEGKLSVQAHGDGPVSLLLADYTSDGGVRGFARFDHQRLDQTGSEAEPVDARKLLGDGRLALTIDQGPQFDLYQSVAPIEGAHLSAIAEHYFAQSEQVPTRIILSVAQFGPDAGGWRAGGVILQRIAGDDARGDSDEAWNEGLILLNTVEPGELVDPSLASDRVLFRLFHETGVRAAPAQPVFHQCTCSLDRVRQMLAGFPEHDLREFAEPDGKLCVNCEYCNRQYRLAPEDIRP